MSYQLELRHFRYFLAVAEELHFRKAAERLYISQPGLSRQIKEMEQGIGIQLFERHNRSVQLTKAGAYLKEELGKYVNGLEQVIQHAKLIHDGLQGDLKLGYVGSAIQKVIPELLNQFRDEHPKVLFSLKEMENQDQIENLLSFDIDVGFVRLERMPREIKSHTLLTEPFCLVLPKNHPINRDNFSSMKQLKEESFILFAPKYSASYYERIMQIFDDAGFIPQVSHNTINSTTIYKLVENNFGVSIVPNSLSLDYLEGVKFVELHDIPQRTVLSLVWNTHNGNPILKKFLEVAV